MPNYFEYVTFAYRAYKDDPDIPPMPPGWNERDTIPCPPEFQKHDYYGIAFINCLTKQVIISHRGTIFGTGWWEDILMWLYGHAPAQFKEGALPFIKHVKQILQQAGYADFTISYTGHSLGAILAELSAARDLKSAVTFESPGSMSLIAQLINNGTIPASRLDHAKKNCITFNSQPDFINILR